MKYKLALFDMDGTILNTIEDLKNSVNYALSKYNYPLHTVDKVQSFVGNGIAMLIKRAAPKDTDQATLDDLYNIFTEHYKVHFKDKTCPYEGITECLKKLKQDGIKLAVVSNKDDYAVKELAELFFGDLFDLAVGPKTGVRPKPEKDMVNLAFEHFNVDKSSTVYIGDSGVDFNTASNSELDFIGVSWGFKGREFLQSLGTKVVVDNCQELYLAILNA